MSNIQKTLDYHQVPADTKTSDITAQLSSIFDSLSCAGRDRSRMVHYPGQPGLHHRWAGSLDREAMAGMRTSCPP